MNAIKKVFAIYMRVLILESCLRTQFFVSYMSAQQRSFLLCPAVLPLFFFEHLTIYCHLIHLLHATCLPVEKVACVPGEVYFQKMSLGAMTVIFQFTVPMVYPPRYLVSLSTLACIAIHAMKKILWQCWCQNLPQAN